MLCSGESVLSDFARNAGRLRSATVEAGTTTMLSGAISGFCFFAIAITVRSVILRFLEASERSWTFGMLAVEMVVGCVVGGSVGGMVHTEGRRKNLEKKAAYLCAPLALT